jgi:hypothetical protein
MGLARAADGDRLDGDIRSLQQIKDRQPIVRRHVGVDHHRARVGLPGNSRRCGGRLRPRFGPTAGHQDEQQDTYGVH